MEANQEIENVGKRSGITDVSITNRIQKIEERISGAEDTVEEIDTMVKEYSKHKKKLLTQNIWEIQDTMKRSSLRIIGIEENEDSQLWPENIFNKVIEENFPNLKKEMAKMV